MSRGQIYTELSDVIAPKHSMLIVWDMQDMLVNRAFNKDEILNSVQALLQAARRVEVPVVYTKITPLPPRFQAPAAIAQQMKRMGIKDVRQLRSPFDDDPKAREIAGSIAPLPEDIVLKQEYGQHICRHELRLYRQVWRHRNADFYRYIYRVGC
jgi:isochorismate hydrolase